MRLLAEVRHRLRTLWRRERMDAESAEEFEFHVGMEADRLIAAGVDPAEARRRALAAFGGTTATAQAVHEARGTRWLEDLAHDLRYAARQLRRSPTFTAVAVVTLALGIGANTAIFSVVDGVLLRPAPVADIGRLVVVWETDRASGTTREPASWPDFEDFQRLGRTLGASAALAGSDVTLTGSGGEPAVASAVAASANYFSLIGVTPLLGRSPTPEEDRPGGPLVAMIGERLWRSRFAADRGVLGRTLVVDGQSYEIIGVVPAGADFGVDQIHLRAAYHGAYAGAGDVDVWVPAGPSHTGLPRDTHPIFVVGRLAPGTSLAAAQDELGRVAERLEEQYASNANRGVHVEALYDVVFSPVRPVLRLLLAAVVLVLLVACVNVANLLLARGTRRTREVAVRSALGAGFTRLGRQFMAESVVLALLGGAAGLGVAWVGLKLLLALAPADVPRIAEVGLDLRVLLATLAISVLVGLAFGLVPVIQSFKVDVVDQVKNGGTGVGLTRRRHWLRAGLVVTELALSVTLVLSAGLLVRSFRAVLRVDPGFEAAGVLKADYQLPLSRYPRDFSRWPNWSEHFAFTDQVVRAAAAIPGVTAAAIASHHPLDAGFTNSWQIVDRPDLSQNLPEISVRAVTPSYFATLRAKLVAGRFLSEGDRADQAAVAVLNQTAVTRFFGGADPIGMSARWWGTNRRIVGVVADERIRGLTEAAPPIAYAPLAQAPMNSGVLLVRTVGHPEAVGSQVRDVVHRADPQLAVFGIEPLERTVLASVGERRFAMAVLTVFGGLTLVLAVVGVYGVLSYATAERTREIGIRTALGAKRSAVARLVVHQGVRLAAAGIAVGLAGAAGGSRLLRSMLFGVSPIDPATYLAVSAGVLAAALGAVAVPAWRAARVPPVEALRTE